MKKSKRMIAVTLIAAVIVAAAIYTRPMKISELCFNIDIAQSEAVIGHFRTAPDRENTYFEIARGDPRFLPFITLFQEKKFRKSIANLLPERTEYRVIKDGDFSWDLFFVMDEVAFPDGNSASGALLSFVNFHGDLTIWCHGEEWHCTTNNQDEWLGEVMSLLSSAPNE